MGGQGPERDGMKEGGVAAGMLLKLRFEDAWFLQTRDAGFCWQKVCRKVFSSALPLRLCLAEILTEKPIARAAKIIRIKAI